MIMNTLKKALTAIALLTFSCLLSPEAQGWGNLGHATVAKIAQDHLSPKARKAIKKYIGVPLPAIASDADVFRGVWTMDLGFIPTNPDDARVAFVKNFDFSTPLNISPWSHSITVDENFKCFPTDNLDGAYINNDAYYVTLLSKKLREEAETMDPYERYKAIALIVHFLGDMHCPMHVVYLPANTVKGHIDVLYKGKKISLHSFWDNSVFETNLPKSFGDLAYLADNADKKGIKEITEGDVFDWAGRTAEKCWPLNNTWHDGDTLPSTYATEMRTTLLEQLRDAGYRLAKVRNETFK